MATVDGCEQPEAAIVRAASNALIITERPSRMGRIRDTITKLDKATEQVMIETKFVEVTDRDVRLAVLFGYLKADLAAGRGEFDRVIEQVKEKAPQVQWVGGNIQRMAGGLEGYGYLLSRSHDFALFVDLADKFVHLHGFKI